MSRSPKPCACGRCEACVSVAMYLARVLEIQAAVNAAADELVRPRVDILNAAEVARIEELIAAETWPDGWDGTEPRADVPLDRILPGGGVQWLLRGLEET